MNEDDLSWLYAAYKKGCFGPLFAPDMQGPDFKADCVKMLMKWPHRWVVRARYRGTRELHPIGLVVATSDMHRLSPHAIWFPWATRRNIVEGLLGFLRDATEAGWLVIIASGDKYRDFFTKLMRYGIVKRVGVIPGWFADQEAAVHAIEGSGADAMFFYARKK